MKLTTNYRNIKTSNALNYEIQETFEKFQKYFDKELECFATMSLKGKNDDNKCVEITIKSGKYDFRAESVTDDWHKSVDENFDKIKKQIRRHKDKILSKKRPIFEQDFSFEENTAEEVEIIREKTVNVKPMSPEEATMQMDLIGHTFFVFLNADTEQINVVYKRNNGGYGIIVPHMH